jgi:pyruvate ferredoxin oxidoreductase beta subunit
VPVDDYLKPQRRFAHLFASDEGRARLAQVQAIADRNIADYKLLEQESEA